MAKSVLGTPGIQAAEPERSSYLTAQQHLDSLRRLRNFILAHTDGKLVAWDSDYIGDRDIGCSWGQCTRRPEQWPDDTRKWLERPLNPDGRVYGVKYNQNGQFCPFDRQAPEGDPMHGMSMGCFNRCRIFHPDEGGRPSREEALTLFDAAIAQYEAKGNMRRDG